MCVFFVGRFFTDGPVGDVEKLALAMAGGNADELSSYVYVLSFGRGVFD